MIRISAALSICSVAFATFIGPAAWAESPDCERPLLREDMVAKVFPGVDRTFFKLFHWTYDGHPIVRVKFDGVPVDARAAEVLKAGLTRLDPRRHPLEQPEFYRFNLRVRTGDRALAARLTTILEEKAAANRIALDCYTHWVTNRYVRDGDVLVSFGDGGFAKHVAAGFEITRALERALVDGLSLAQAIESLADPRALAPPPLALPPHSRGTVH